MNKNLIVSDDIVIALKNSGKSLRDVRKLLTTELTELKHMTCIEELSKTIASLNEIYVSLVENSYDSFVTADHKAKLEKLNQSELSQYKRLGLILHLKEELNWTYTQIGHYLQITSSRVYQLHSKAKRIQNYKKPCERLLVITNEIKRQIAEGEISLDYEIPPKIIQVPKRKEEICEAVTEASNDLIAKIIVGVDDEGCSFDEMNKRHQINCAKEIYYKAYVLLENDKANQIELATTILKYHDQFIEANNIMTSPGGEMGW